jgi:hypothetical protein
MTRQSLPRGPCSTEYTEMQYDYHHTHRSKNDGSEAMMIWGCPFVLMNEDGYTWQPNPDDWEEI